jgi:hypothetical protein
MYIGIGKCTFLPVVFSVYLQLAYSEEGERGLLLTVFEKRKYSMPVIESAERR